VKRNITLFGIVLLAAWTAVAQDATPRVETFFGYDMLRYNSARGIPAFTANGAGGQLAINFNSWLGGVADIYAAHNGNVFGSYTNPTTGTVYPGGKIDNTSVFYQFGPRISIRKWHRVTPFFQILLGAQTVAASVPVDLPAGTVVTIAVPGGSRTFTSTGRSGLRAGTGQTGFAYLIGGGLDIKINKLMTFRAIGADLQFTRLAQLTEPQTTRSQYNFRYSTGINFTFGGAQ
jgi:hypothetical protein